MSKDKKSGLSIDIEDIKALDPGKVYAVSLDVISNMDAAQNIVETLSDIGKEYNLKFIYLTKGSAELISAPEGIEVKLTNVEAY